MWLRKIVLATRPLTRMTGIPQRKAWVTI